MQRVKVENLLRIKGFKTIFLFQNRIDKQRNKQEATKEVSFALIKMMENLQVSRLFKITRNITYLYNFDALKLHFYLVRVGFTGVYIIFLISAQKHRLWVLVRNALSRRFYQVPSINVLGRNMKISDFLSEHYQFLVVKFSIYLNRHVFVMAVSHEIKGITSYIIQVLIGLTVVQVKNNTGKKIKTIYIQPFKYLIRLS